MCTAIHFKGERSYLGRNLDLSNHLKQDIVITPANYPLTFNNLSMMESHLAILGIGMIVDDYPLYSDALNEKGLAMAALNFPFNATYHKRSPFHINLSPYELIPFILGKCQSVNEALFLLHKIILVDIPFSEKLPNAPLHFILADSEQSIIIEPMSDGLKIYKDEIGVLTNNPPYPYHLENIAFYRYLSPYDNSDNLTDQNLDIKALGSGSYGLPGDYTPASRFIKALYLKNNVPYPLSKDEDINEFMHIFDNISVPKGAVYDSELNSEYTVYTSIADMQDIAYYYKTYDDYTIKKYVLNDKDKYNTRLTSYSL